MYSSIVLTLKTGTSGSNWRGLHFGRPLLSLCRIVCSSGDEGHLVERHLCCRYVITSPQIGAEVAVSNIRNDPNDSNT